MPREPTEAWSARRCARKVRRDLPFDGDQSATWLVDALVEQAGMDAGRRTCRLKLPMMP